MTFSDASGVGFRRDISQTSVALKGEPQYLIDSLLGLQLNARYRQKWGAVLQLRIRDQIEKDLNDYLKLAFLSYQVNPSLSVRAGLLPIDAYMLSESRDVKYTYPWVRPNFNFYAAVVLNNFKGMDISYRHFLGDGMLEWRLGGGNFSTYSVLTQKAVTYLEFKDFITFTLLYDLTPFSVRFSLLDATVDKMTFVQGMDDIVTKFLAAVPKLPPSASDLFSNNTLAGSKVDQYALALTYDQNSWLIQSEASYINYQGSNPVIFYSGYLSVAYRIGKWTPYAVVSRLYSGGRKGSTDFIRNIDPNIADDVAEVVGLTVRRGNQSTLNLGARWNINSNVALKAQWGYHRLGKFSNYGWAGNEGHPMEKHVNTFTLSMDFLF